MRTVIARSRSAGGSCEKRATSELVSAACGAQSCGEGGEPLDRRAPDVFDTGSASARSRSEITPATSPSSSWKWDALDRRWNVSHTLGDIAGESGVAFEVVNDDRLAGRCDEARDARAWLEPGADDGVAGLTVGGHVQQAVVVDDRHRNGSAP